MSAVSFSMFDLSVRSVERFMPFISERIIDHGKSFQTPPPMTLLGGGRRPHEGRLGGGLAGFWSRFRASFRAPEGTSEEGVDGLLGRGDDHLAPY